ncbi:MAG TPA: pirin family protein [Oligoflexus sp.]|uniref:pirin family protein n=1 Tax=Oligoflexus sp. TaxID=1971216 RepID=UPI002D7FB49D|nr:pirin family protein [Oligoflexus sp.]HET9239035.1 pirin family protein [Oligoflexus sp.]
MSWMPTREPECDVMAEDGIEMLIQPRLRDLGGFSVSRILPAIGRKTVGPFIFFDHMPPRDVPPGEGMNVRPHPHIALATVTYLFEGEFVHRDSLGSLEMVRPGDINWMTAGRGIVHSERTHPERLKTGGRSHGIQLWVALPKEHEETEPAFHHHDKDELPRVTGPGFTVRVLIGEAYGQKSPVKIFSPMFYCDVQAEVGASLELPHEYAERALYLLSGTIRHGGKVFDHPQMIIFKKDCPIRLHVESEARFVLLGGAALDGPRVIWWNFISSSQARIDQAKKDWQEGRFPLIPGDSDEFIPLPES